MGKAGKERKRLRLLSADKTGKKAHYAQVPAKSAAKRPHNDDDEDVLDDDTELVGGLISASDLAKTIATLVALEEQPEVMRSKAFKGLRIALHRLNQATSAAGVNNGNSLSGRISDALTDGRWNDALVALGEMRERSQTPKLGALQRWVRECDAVGSTEGLDGNPQVLRVLDAILRTADPSMVPPADGADTSHVVRRHPPWAPRPLYEGKDEPLEEVDYKSKFRVVAHEKGPERRTPNLHDFILYASLPGTIPPPPPSHPEVTRLDIPHVPGAFVMLDVLSRTQCRQILAATEDVGFTPDAPIAGAAGEQTSVLAHNMFWLADDALIRTIMARCGPHLPPQLAGGDLAGLNARWRVYRYIPGAVYRPHIDGAWPGSGLDSTTGEYVYDIYGDRRSKLTFLLYLNEDFEGGATTFFTPASEEGKMDAWPIRPRAGCVVCFPHGEAKGALLHEGSALVQSKVTGSTKYIIRTDVLYTLPEGVATAQS